jgi:hypothetical protein
VDYIEYLYATGALQEKNAGIGDFFKGIGSRIGAAKSVAPAARAATPVAAPSAVRAPVRLPQRPAPVQINPHMNREVLKDFGMFHPDPSASRWLPGASPERYRAVDLVGTPQPALPHLRDRGVMNINPTGRRQYDYRTSPPLFDKASPQGPYRPIIGGGGLEM